MDLNFKWALKKHQSKKYIQYIIDIWNRLLDGWMDGQKDGNSDEDLHSQNNYKSKIPKPETKHSIIIHYGCWMTTTIIQHYSWVGNPTLWKNWEHVTSNTSLLFPPGPFIGPHTTRNRAMVRICCPVQWRLIPNNHFTSAWLNPGEPAPLDSQRSLINRQQITMFS